MSQILVKADPAKVDRYLKIERWARKRYTDQSGRVVITVGGKPTRYALIENVAAVKLCGFNDRYGKAT